MAQVKVDVTVTKPPTDVMVKLNNRKIKMSRNLNADWTGSATLDLPKSFQLQFRAVGIAGAQWTLTLKFTPSGGTGSGPKIERNGTIPDDTLMSELKETITL